MVSAKQDHSTPDLFSALPVQEAAQDTSLTDLSVPKPICRKIGKCDSKLPKEHFVQHNAFEIQLESAGKIGHLAATVLSSRGFHIGEDFDLHINAGFASLPSLDDVAKFPELHQSIIAFYRILIDAKVTGKKIALVNDFDADGFTSTAIFVDLARAAGLNIEVFETRRSDLSRGVTNTLAERIVDANSDVIVTFDIGTENGPQLRYAKERAAQRAPGKKDLITVILDHHDVRPEVGIPADVFINLHRPGWELGGAIFSTAALSFFVSKWLSEIPGKENPFAKVNIKRLLDLAFIGTTCDMMDFIGHNRTIARLGAQVLSRTDRPGLRALINLLKLGDRITAEHVGVFIGPCLNAAGRLNKIDLVIEFLTSRDPLRAAELSEILFQTNKDRRELQQSVKSEMRKNLTPEMLARPALVLFLERYIENAVGVVGLLAGGFGEEYLIPSFISAKDMNGNFTGSARGIRSDISIHQCYASPEVRPLLISGGGHDAVGGHSISFDNRGPLKDGIESNIREQIAGRRPDDSINWDMEVHLSQLNYAAIRNIEKYVGPFGNKNPAPRFLIRGLAIETVKVWGGEHTALFVHQASDGNKPQASCGAVMWHNNFHPAFKPNAVIDVVCHAAIKPFRGQKSTVRLDILAADESDSLTKRNAHVNFTDRRIMLQEEIPLLRENLNVSEDQRNLISPHRKRGGNQRTRFDNGLQDSLEFSVPPEKVKIQTPEIEGFDLAKMERESERARTPTLEELSKQYDLSFLREGSIKESEERMKLLQYFLEHFDRNIVFQSPTGSGKTYIFLLLIASVISSKGRVLIITPQVELTDQVKGDAEKVLKKKFEAIVTIEGDSKTVVKTNPGSTVTIDGETETIFKLSPRSTLTIIGDAEAISKDTSRSLVTIKEDSETVLKVKPGSTVIIKGESKRVFKVLPGFTVSIKGNPEAITTVNGAIPRSKRIQIYPDLTVPLIVATPEVIMNDFVTDGLYSLRQFDLVVIDEAHHLVGQSAMAQVAREAAPGTRIIACSAYPAPSQERLFELTHTLNDAAFLRLEGDKKPVKEEEITCDHDPKTQEALDHLRSYARRVATDLVDQIKPVGELHSRLKKSLRELVVSEKGRTPGAYGVRATIQEIKGREFASPIIKNSLFLLDDLCEILYMHELLSSYGKFVFLHEASERLWNFRVESVVNNKKPNLKWRKVSGSAEFNRAFEIISKDTPFHALAMSSKNYGPLLEAYEHDRKGAFAAFISEGRQHLIKREELDSKCLAEVEETVRKCLTHMPERQHIIFSGLNLMTNFIEARLNHRLGSISDSDRLDFGDDNSKNLVALRFVGKGHISGAQRKENLDEFRKLNVPILNATSAAAEGHHLPGISYGHVLNPTSQALLAVQMRGRVGRDGFGSLRVYLATNSVDQIRYWRCRARIREMEKMKRFKPVND